MHGVESLGFAFCPNCAIIEALSTLFRRLLLWASYFLRDKNITLKDGTSMQPNLHNGTVALTAATALTCFSHLLLATHASFHFR